LRSRSSAARSGTRRSNGGFRPPSSMARKFLYAIVGLVVAAIAVAVALRLWGGRLSQVAFVPSTEFEAQAPLPVNAYDDPALWYWRPGAPTDDSDWRPEGAPPPAPGAGPTAVFFVHPTSYLERAHWNAALDDRESQDRARLFLRGMASAFGDSGVVWAPRYRQATFGAFLTDQPEAAEAIDLAYRDVSLAFDAFLDATGP